MLVLLRRVLGPTKREFRDEIARLDTTIREKDKEIAQLTQRAYDGDALLSHEIDKLNDENDQINHDRTTLKFENERLKKERDLERAALAERAKEARASALRIEGLIKENEEYLDRLDKQADAYAAKCEEMRHKWDKIVGPLREEIASGKTYAKLLADEKERLRLRVVNLSEELEAVVATSSETIGELKEQIEEGKALLNEGIEHVDRLVAENERLQRMIAEPEFLKAEARKEGGRMVADATMKHWAAKLMIMSFHDSIGTAENLVELFIGDEEFGHFVVTVRRRDRKPATQIIDELKERVRTLEIALEASAEMEQEWNAERDELKGKLRRCERIARRHSRDALNANGRADDWAAKSFKLEHENEHVKNVCVELRRSRDDLYVTLSDLIRIDSLSRELNADNAEDYAPDRPGEPGHQGRSRPGQPLPQPLRPERGRRSLNFSSADLPVAPASLVRGGPLLSP